MKYSDYNRPLKVPVFEYLDNLYDIELECYISEWESERVNREANGLDATECDEKLQKLYEEKERRINSGEMYD